MAWIFLAALAGSQKPSKGTSSPSLTVKTIDTLKAYSYLSCPAGGCRRLQSGMMCDHSEAQFFHRPSTSFTADSPAKTLAVPDAEKAWAASAADYFSRSFASLARYDPSSSSWKMCQLYVHGEETLSPDLWPASGMTVGGTLYPLQTWARITDESGGGFLPTPRAADADKNIRTPQGRAKERLCRKNGEDLPTVLGGKPNPKFLEWTMGLPIGWTELDAAVDLWFRPKRGKRSRD